MAKKSTTKIEGEYFTHKVLWQCALHQMEAGRSTNKGGRLYFDMATMLMVFLTYEAYLNFLGNHVAPEIWRNERIYFSKPPYVGVNGKLKKILEVCGNINVDKGKRPYQTIQELRKLRDFLSHGKPIKFGKTISHHVDHDPPLFDTGLSKYITPRKAERAIKDTEQFIDVHHIKPNAVVFHVVNVFVPFRVPPDLHSRLGLAPGELQGIRDQIGEHLPDHCVVALCSR